MSLYACEGLVIMWRWCCSTHPGSGWCYCAGIKFSCWKNLVCWLCLRKYFYISKFNTVPAECEEDREFDPVSSPDVEVQGTRERSTPPMLMEELLERRCCVRKYHVYRGQRQVLICEREPDRDIAEARRQPNLTPATWRELDSCSQNTWTWRTV